MNPKPEVVSSSQIVIWDARWNCLLGYMTRKHKIFVDGKTRGNLTGHLADGRPVVKKNGQWRYEVR